MRRVSDWCFPVLVISLALALGGCQEAPKSKTAPAPAKAAAAAPAVDIEALMADAKADDYRYGGLSRRDPFVPLVALATLEVAGRTEPLEPLEQFDLTQLKIGALMIGLSKPRAMIQAPDGKAYIVVPGNRAGKNGGIISRITKDGVFVEEEYTDVSGNVAKTVKQIELPKREGV